MASLLEIKKKIGGVKNTRKITKAMQLVAASKMRQFQKEALSSRNYVWSLLEILEKNLGTGHKTLYNETRDSGKTLFVLYTSDKGLCGPLNTKLINQLFRSNAWNDLGEEERELVTIGRKGFEYANNRNIPVTQKFLGVPEKMTNLDALEIIDQILMLWKEKAIKEVIFVAPHYKNSFTFYPVLKTFLPFSQKTIDSSLGMLEEDDEKPEWKKDENTYMLFNPSEEEVALRLYEQLVQALFIQAFMELKSVEYSSRMMAMQSATDSADRMIDDLTKVYNKARQAAITQEIAELVAGAESVE